jgi:hypothetical protein
MAQSPARARLHVNLMPMSPAETLYLPKMAAHRPRLIQSADRVAQIAAQPSYDLIYQGGKTLPNLTFTIFYLGGDAAWQASDRTNIDQALAAAMADRDLNNVMGQYFSTPITSTFRASSVLAGSPPQTVDQSTAEQMLVTLHQQGKLQGYDLTQTVFCLALPSGTVLRDSGSGGGMSARVARTAGDTSVSSLQGLGGYHGAAQDGSTSIYYAIVVYGEHLSSGQDNGIVAFPTPWKNVVAAFYHELNEARTDANVNGTPGWISNPISDFGGQSVEVGDAPVFEAGNNLSLVFQEVPLADGGGTVPVQFMWSNAVHGPEGPRTTPDPRSPNGTPSGGANWGIILAIVAILALAVGAFFVFHH